MIRFREDAMIQALDWFKHASRLAGATGVVALLITGAHAVPSYGALDQVDSTRAFTVVAQADDDDDDDDDEDDSRGFVFDEDEGSLLVDIENCAPGKYWMLDIEDGVMLPCK
jgi:hypothetical protein